MHKIDFDYLTNVSVVDLETTGLNANIDRIVSVSALQVDLTNVDDPVRDALAFYVNPTVPIPEEASKIHGIWDKDVENLETFGDRSEELMTFIGAFPIVGYNVQFDINFLNAELRRIERQTLEGRNYYCVMHVLWDSWGYRPTLKHAIARFGLDGWGIESREMEKYGKAHEAFYDTVGTALIAARIKSMTPMEVQDSGDMWSGSDKANHAPTEKQMAFLMKLGGNPKKVHTKKDASRYIDLLKTGRGHEFQSKVQAVRINKTGD